MAGSVRPNGAPGVPRIKWRAIARDPRYIVLALLIIGIVAAAIVWFDKLQPVWKQIASFKPSAVATALGCQVVKYLAIALTFHLLLRVLNHRIPVPFLFGSGIAMVFFNQTMPSMGTSGNAFMYAALQRRGVSGGSAVIVTILNMLTYYIAFFLLATGAMVYLALIHALKGIQIAGASTFFGLMIILFVWIHYRTRTIERFRRTVDDINRLIKRLSRGSLVQAIPDHFVDDFFQGRALIVNAKKRFILPVLTNLIMFLADSATLLVVIKALGSPVVLYRHVVGAYVLGVILYAFAVVPGALGLYEGGMAAMLIAFGIMPARAVAGTVLFRGFSFWLPIPIGFVIYYVMMHARRRTTETARQQAPQPPPNPEPLPPQAPEALKTHEDGETHRPRRLG